MAALADELQQARLHSKALCSAVAGDRAAAPARGQRRCLDAGCHLASRCATDLDRLCRWQSALFRRHLGLQRITVERLRDHEDPMQIVGSRPGREVVHYTAPPQHRSVRKWKRLWLWFEASRPGNAPPDNETPLNGIVRRRAGTGRWQFLHLFGLSSVLLSSRRAYHDALNAAQCVMSRRGSWFVRVYASLPAIAADRAAGDRQVAFWQRATEQSINERQRKILARLVEAGDGGFLGDMTDKYAKITRASKATTTRDLADLLTKALLVVEGVGKASLCRQCRGLEPVSPHPASQSPSPPDPIARTRSDLRARHADEEHAPFERWFQATALLPRSEKLLIFTAPSGKRATTPTATHRLDVTAQRRMYISVRFSIFGDRGLLDMQHIG